MKNLGCLITIFLFLTGGSIFAQNVTVEGFIFASNNTGYISGVEVQALIGDTPLISVTSDANGQFSISVPSGKEINLVAKKQGYKEGSNTVSTVGKTGEVVYTKIAMKRSPGYIFEATLSELVPADHEGPIDALTETTIEIYNNTKEKEVLVLKDHPIHTFSFTFEKGNHYTIMIRKKGFFTKRLEANVDINDCLLCFEGIGTIRPGVSDNLTASGGYQSGVLGTDIKLKRVVMGEPIEINNIYFDLGKSDIREDALPELDKLAGILRDNPHLLIELGSHTDSRGSSENNNVLSAKRAKSTADYLILKGVEQVRLASRGYGESKLKNGCKDDVKCSERKHQVNRRTEFIVTGVLSENPYDKKSLRKIIKEERFEQNLRDLESSVVEVPVDTVSAEKGENDKTEQPGKIANDLLGGSTETIPIPVGADPSVRPQTQAPPSPKKTTITEKKATIEELPTITEKKATIEEPPTIAEEKPTTIEEPPAIVEKTIEEEIPEENAASFIFGGSETLADEKKEIIKEADPGNTVIDKLEVETPDEVAEAEELYMEVRPNNVTEVEEIELPTKKIVKSTPSEIAPAPEEVTTEVNKQGVQISATQYRHPSAKEMDKIIPSPEIEETPSKTNVSDEELAILEELLPHPGDNIDPLVNKLSRSYTGYKIEIVASDIELPLTHDVFKEFGKLDVELNVQKKYHYLMGDFRNGNLAQTFLQRSILQRYPNARVVHYQGGERINL